MTSSPTADQRGLRELSEQHCCLELARWLAAELTHTDAQQLTDKVSSSGSYFRIYPSLHINRSLSDETTLSFGASRRVSRPDPGNLNPYVTMIHAEPACRQFKSATPVHAVLRNRLWIRGKGLTYQLTAITAATRTA